MDIFILSKSQHICYNSSVPQKRDESIFDRGGRQIAPAVGPKPGSCIPRDRIGRAACPHAATSTADGKTLVGARIPRACLPKELRKRIRRPQCIRNSVLKLPGNHYYSRMRQKYDVAPCGNHAAQPLSSASSRLVVVPLGNRISRVRRFLFVPKWRHPVG